MLTVLVSLCLPVYDLTSSLTLSNPNPLSPFRLEVPYTATVKLKRPIGLHVVEGPGKQVYVQSVKPELSAARSKRVEVGE